MELRDLVPLSLCSLEHDLNVVVPHDGSSRQQCLFHRSFLPQFWQCFHHQPLFGKGN